MTYSSLISIGNLFQAWDEFKKGKRNKLDVQVFERNLEDNLFNLHQKLSGKTYKHGNYSQFYVNDPKRRHIHKASVCDRIVHHLLYKYLYAIFDKTFIYDSYSCRLEKGTHKAVKRLENFARVVSKNYTQDCWALKLDIKKFFAAVDHEILFKLIKRMVEDKDILWLIEEILVSFYSNRGSTPKGVGPLKGIPLGNLTSQIFANVYLNQLDQFVKHKLKVEYYLRYADDFIFLCRSKTYLYRCIDTLKQFLEDELRLELHPSKVNLCKLAWGIDFCGYIFLPHHILPRSKTKRRIFRKLKMKIDDLKARKISSDSFKQSVQSYLGYLSHAASYKLTQELKNYLWFTADSE